MTTTPAAALYVEHLTVLVAEDDEQAPDCATERRCEVNL